MTEPSNAAEPRSGLRRRDFLRGSAGTAALLGAGAVLSACGRSDSTSPTSGAATGTGTSAASTAAAAGTPKRGGTLRVGMKGAGKNEAFSLAVNSGAPINNALVNAVFDGFMRVGPDLKLKPGLVTEWTSNADSTAWTLKLRQGVTWHDGKPFTIEDAMYSMHWMATPGSQLTPAVSAADLSKLKKIDEFTLLVPMKAPSLDFPYDLAAIGYVVQNGAKVFTKPVGTGPFIYESFTQGEQAVMRRNPKYWESPKPYVDKLIIQSIDDDTARLNALKAGQVDIMAQVPFDAARSGLGSGISLLTSPSTALYGFYMAIDRAPYNDVRVRQAMRLIVNRQQMVNVALNGFGAVANDLFGTGVPFYDSALPQRQQDIAKAKELLAAAGHKNGLTLELKTAAAEPGFVESATLLQQQAKAAGVTIKITQVDPGTYFDATHDYLKMPFAQTYWTGNTMSAFYQYSALPGGVANETHWVKTKTTAQIKEALAAKTPSQAKAVWTAVQEEQYADGGYIFWGNVDNIDGLSSKVKGIVASRWANIGLPTGFADAWLA